MKKYNAVRLIGRMMKRNKKSLKKSLPAEQPEATKMIDKLKNIKNIGNIIPGGDAKGMKVADFSPEDLWMGVQEESEHTDDIRIATEIAMDHLSQDKDYYRKLKAAGID